MEIRIETSSYNEKRYGKPWIARVDFSTSKKGDFRFGSWTGQKGEEGILFLQANINDVVARGQKDNRNSRYNAPEFYFVNASGELEPLASKVAAYKHYEQHKKSTADADKESLRAELATLKQRVAEIEQTLLSEGEDDKKTLTAD